MSKNCSYILIVEDDPFAAKMMALLLSRDYRTRVVGELTDEVKPEIFDSLNALREAGRPRGMDAEHASFSLDPDQPVDVVLLNVENAADPDLPLKIMAKLSKWDKPPKVLCVCIHPSPETARKVLAYNCFAGYLAKSEVLYCIASAACLAANGYTVTSPGVAQILLTDGSPLPVPNKTLVLSLHTDVKKKRVNAKLGADILRLKLLFNLHSSEIEDELCTSGEYVAQVVSRKYTSLQMSDIIAGRVYLRDLLASPYLDNERIILHFQKILNDLPAIMERRKNKARNPKFRNMDTLAFHLITRPDIIKW